jgi:ABC-type antimicrobial peptide transport system permease subunit
VCAWRSWRGPWQPRGLGATRFIRSLLWGVSETDVVTYLVVAGLLLLVAIVASVGPALRIRRLDPAALLLTRVGQSSVEID